MQHGQRIMNAEHVGRNTRRTLNPNSTPAIDPSNHRPVPGFDGYRVSTEGVIESCRVKGWHGRRGPWRPLKIVVTPLGYGRVTMTDDAGKTRPRWVHRIVLEAWVGPRPPGMIACHNDGDRLNNHPSNLRWDTQSGNLADRRRHGTQPTGSRQAGAKLTESAIPEILRLKSEGVTAAEIGRRFGVSKHTVYGVFQRRGWRHAFPTA